MLTRVESLIITNVEADNTGTSLPTIIKDDVLILNSTMSVLTGTPTATSAVGNDVIYLAYGIGTGNPKLTPKIPLRGIRNVKLASYVAPAEDIYTIGYDGTTGALPTPDNNQEYSMIVAYFDNYKPIQNRQIRNVWNTTTDNTATAAELAFQLAKTAGKDIKKYQPYPVKFEVLSAGASVALTSSGTTTVTNGSNVVTSATHGITGIGTIVRLGGSSTSTAVYRVQSVIDANNFVIEEFYQGASSVTAVAGTVATNTTVGIRISGIPIVTELWNLEIKSNFQVSLFPVTTLGNGGANTFVTPVHTANMTYGSGYYISVRELEFATKGWNGTQNWRIFPEGTLTAFATDTVVNNTYNIITIEYVQTNEGELQDDRKDPAEIAIAFYSSTAPSASTKQTTFTGILTSLVNSVGVRFN